MTDKTEQGGESPPQPTSPEESAKSQKRRRRRRSRRAKPKSAGIRSVAAGPAEVPNESSSVEKPDESASQTSHKPKRSRHRSTRRGHPSVRRRPVEGRNQHVFAAVDLGTNNCRLLVARPEKESFKVIDAFSRTIRLGAGLTGTGALAGEAMDRAVEALKVCASKIKRRDATKVRCIATEACRTAVNGEEFINRIKSETGLDFEVITTAREAHLAAAGCMPLLDYSSESALVFDIGGGSTELVWLDLASTADTDSDPKIVAWTSLPFGVVTLAEQYHTELTHPELNVRSIFERMTRDVQLSIEAYVEAEHLRPIYDRGAAHLIGNSGTVTTLAAVYLDLERYDRKRVDGVWMNTKAAHQLIHKISHLDAQERSQFPCIGEDRADLMLPGCAILKAISDAWPSERIRVADRGLREGILLELMEEADREAKRKRRNRRRRRSRGGPRRSSSNPSAEGHPPSGQ